MTTTAISQTSSAAAEHPLRNPYYRRLLTGATISLLGDQFYLVALPWLVLQHTGSAVAMGTLLMAGAIPRAVLMLMGGALTDRVSPRKIMMSTAAARTVCVTVIGLLVWFRLLQTWQLYALAVAFGIADAFAAPAAQAYLPFLLKREQLVAASSISQTSVQLTTIVGPVHRRVRHQVAGDRLGILYRRHQLPLHHRRVVQASRSTLVQGPKKAMWHSIMDGIDYVRKDVPLLSLMLLVPA